jgi:hypothetical protein
MEIYAVIENNEIKNIINWDGKTFLSPEIMSKLIKKEIGDNLNIGATIIDGVWTPKPIDEQEEELTDTEILDIILDRNE